MSAERYRQYVICKERGHAVSGERFMTNPPYDICRHCGTGFRFEQVLSETNVPAVEPDVDADEEPVSLKAPRFFISSPPLSDTYVVMDMKWRERVELDHLSEGLAALIAQYLNDRDRS